MRMPTQQTIALPGAAGVLAIEAGDLVQNYQIGIDVPITDLVLGQPRLRMMLGEKIFRPIEVPALRFSYTEYGLEGFEVKDALRGMRAKIQHSDFVLDQIPEKLKRYSWASLADRDEIGNADAFANAQGLDLRVRRKYTSLAQMIVDVSIEQERADIVLAAASYSQSTPDLDLTMGTAWNDTGGDSRTAVRAQASALAAANGVQIEDIKAFITHETLEAAQDDPTWLAKRANFDDKTPTVGQLADYWGIGGVEVGDAYRTDDGATVVSMYGDICVLRVDVPTADYDVTEGRLDSFCRFTWSRFGGVALESWFEKFYTSHVFPWEEYETAATVNVTAAAIIRGTHT